MTGPELLSSLSKLFGSKIRERSEFRGEMTFVIEKGDIREVAKRCRDELSFDYLLDISSVDNF
jgi:NADH-quinone oxidoreductase subunit C